MSDASRVIKRRVSWPGTRALVGALLVTASAVGVFAVARSDRGPDGIDVIVASRDLAAGVALSEDDLATARVQAPAELEARLMQDPEEVVGQVLAAPLRRAEPISATLIGGPGDPSARELALTLDIDRAGGPRLVAGDRVDVISTLDGQADTLATDVAVVAIARSTDGLASSQVVVTLALPDPTAAQLVAGAADGPGVRLIRHQGADR